MDEKRARRFSVLAISALIFIFGTLITIASKSDFKTKLQDEITTAVESATDTVTDTADTMTDSVQQAAPGTYRVTDFVDGDTIKVDMDGRTETLRLIGVDTPETHDPRKAVQCYGELAAAFTKELIGTETVRLEADPTNNNRDKYDRLLRYVYLPDGRLVNAEIIRQGYGFAYILFPFEKMEEFKALESQARSAGLGLWSGCQVSQTGDAKKTNDAGN